MTSAKRNAKAWSQLLTWTQDFIALVALAGTFEVNLSVFAAVFLVFVLSRVTSFKIKDNWLLLFLILTLVGSLVGWLALHLHPIIAAAYAAPFFHSLVWLAQDTVRNRGWRFGIGFTELILASALTSEFYLSALIFIFVLTGSIALSCSFLESELSGRAPELADQALPKNFISQSLWIAFLSLLTSAIIFPILPRTRGDFGSRISQSNVGYTEEVNVSEWKHLSTANSGAPVLRFFAEKDVDLSLEFPLGLIRAKVLDLFDGKRWRPSKKSFIPSSNTRSAQIPIQSVVALREPLGSDVIPTPYGTQRSWTESSEAKIPSSRLSTGEWMEFQSSDRRLNYAFDVAKIGSVKLSIFNKFDQPEEFHLTVPEAMSTDRMQKLANKIFNGTKTERDKIRKLQDYYAVQGFSATLEEDHSESAVSKKLNLNPVESFLFVRKKGHCEFFSTASALLLRMAKVPTRLIAGFRLTQPQVGGVLTVKSGDAHAWIEAWIPETGWVPLDLTPRASLPSGLLTYFAQGYEVLSSYWYRYVLTFDSKAQFSFGIEAIRSVGSAKHYNEFERAFKDFLSRNRFVLLLTSGVALVLAGLVFLALHLWFPWVFSIRWRVREAPPHLRRERKRMEQLLATTLKNKKTLSWEQNLELFDLKYGSQLASELREWVDLYQELRFGQDPQKQKAHLLFQKFKTIKKAIPQNLFGFSKSA